ncbi:MAG: DUF2934 domain-containing protein [Phycisphaerales bacterium]|nr:DUF2934 domain-containing protein [Phycisphaerales bacterium]
MSATVRTRRPNTTNSNTNRNTTSEDAAVAPLIAPQAAVSRPRTPAVQISHARIEERAYQIFLTRNGGPGDATSDWLQAERELLAGCAR